GWNRQAIGGLTKFGGSPLRIVRVIVSPMTGTEDISAFVYGCCGSLNTFCFSPHSMILPAYMTYTYSARYATTATLCVIRRMLIPRFSWSPRSGLSIGSWMH